ncbi:MAG TPA: HAMP domain-containing sensor histidine kinase [Burkholderiaceae bacterium]|jgi:signal transduction histidine kinase
MVTIAAHVQTDQVMLTVNDDGSGMAPAVLARIFDLFYTTKLGKGGSGLALSILHRLFSSVLGGSITAASMVGQGTTFTLTLPTRAPFRM